MSARLWPRGSDAGIRGVSRITLVALALLVITPIFFVVLNSLRFDVAPGEAFDLSPWHEALTDPRVSRAFVNTFLLMIVVQTISMSLGILFAWLIARTDIPFPGALEFMFWIGLLLPTLPIAQGWVLLLDPSFGLVNSAASAIPGVDGPVFNIYSFWGMVWVHLLSGGVAFKVILLAPAFRNVDGNMASASLISGAGRLRTLIKVDLPLIMPAVVAALGLAILFSFRSFELELYLGTPIRFDTFSTLIYRYVQGDPPLYGQATVVASLVLLILLPFVVMQRRFLSRGGSGTVGSQFKPSRIPLGRWRLPAFLAVAAVGLMATVVPLGILGMGTFMKLFGFFDLQPTPWTFDRWTAVLGDPQFLDALGDTLVLGVAAAFLGIVISLLLSYIMVRVRFRGASLLDFFSWLPAALPGIVISLGILWMFLGVDALRPLYGTPLVLVFALFVVGITFGVQLIRGYLAQVGAELEESGRISGGSRMRGIRTIVLPIIMPGVLVAALLLFNGAITNVATVALLARSDTQPLALLQLNYLYQNRYEAAAIAGMVVSIIAVAAAVSIKLLGRRFQL